MAITFRVEPIAEIIEGALWPLLVAHREELTTDKELMALSPIVDVYKAAEFVGRFFAIIVLDDDKIIGYSGNFIAPHLHYSGLRYVHNDVLFLLPEYRKGKLGIKLIQETEREAKERGAQFIVWHAKEGTAFDKLLPRLDYKVQDIIYSKVL